MWSADCPGSADSSWGYYAYKFQNKLHFFYRTGAMLKSLEDPASVVQSGLVLRKRSSRFGISRFEVVKVLLETLGKNR